MTENNYCLEFPLQRSRIIIHIFIHWWNNKMASNGEPVLQSVQWGIYTDKHSLFRLNPNSWCNNADSQRSDVCSIVITTIGIALAWLKDEQSRLRPGYWFGTYTLVMLSGDVHILVGQGGTWKQLVHCRCLKACKTLLAELSSPYCQYIHWSRHLVLCHPHYCSSLIAFTMRAHKHIPVDQGM